MQEKIGNILDVQQIERIEQIKIRVRGVRSLLNPPVAQRIQMTDAQANRIKTTFETLDEQFKKLQDRAAAGEPSDPLTQQASQLQERAQKRIVSLLSDTQKSQFAALIGRSFDVSKLGRVRFKAPEFTPTNDWINAAPTQLVNLHGQVIALHFWTFG